MIIQPMILVIEMLQLFLLSLMFRNVVQNGIHSGKYVRVNTGFSSFV